MIKSVMNQAFPLTLAKSNDSKTNNDVFDAAEDYYDFETPRNSIDSIGSHKYYTIPTKQYGHNTKTPINVIDADFGVFESTKRKRRNPLTGLFKKRYSNNWEENLVNDPKMSLRPEPEVVSKRSKSRNYFSSDNYRFNNYEDYGNDEDDNFNSGLCEYTNQHKVTIKESNNGVRHEYYQENIYRRGSSPHQKTSNSSPHRKPKLISTGRESPKKLSFFSKRKFDNHRKHEIDTFNGENMTIGLDDYYDDDYNTYKDRLQQRKNMEQYELYFVNGMDKPMTSKSRTKSDSRRSHFPQDIRNRQRYKNNDNNQINRSIQTTGESFTRFLASVNKTFNSSMNNSLLSAKSSSEIQKLIIDCISNLPGGNIISPFLILLSKFIPNKDSNEGSLIGTIIVVLSAISLLLFTILSYKIFRFLYTFLSYIYSLAKFFGVSF